jgi:flagellar motor switch protein FliG
VSLAAISKPGTGRRKAAITLVALGPDRAASLLRGLDEEEIRLLALEVANLGAVSPDEVRSTLSELQRDLSTQSTLPAPGAKFARDLLVTALGAERGEVLAQEIERPQPFAWLAEADVSQVAEAMGEEPPGVIALALAHLPGKPAAQILTKLPEGIRVDVAMRIAALNTVHPDTVAEVDAGLRRRVTPLLVNDVTPVAGPELLAELLSFTGRDDERAVLSALATSSPDLADAVRAALLTFDDLAQLDNRALQNLLKAVETRELAVALKTADEATQSKMLSNLSERGRETLLEEIDLLTSVKPADVRTARQAIVATARRLEEEGAIVIARPDEDE